MTTVARRSFLQKLLFVAGVTPVGLIGCRSGRSLETVPTSLDPQSKPGALSRADIDDLVALTGVVVEGRNLGHAEGDYVIEHVEHRARQSPEYVALYRTTVETLGQLAGRRISTLEVGERLEFVRRHRLDDPRLRGDEDPGQASGAVKEVRRRAVPDLIEGYFRSPAGWAVVGYTTFPGRCGDLTRYTRPER